MPIPEAETALASTISRPLALTIVQDKFGAPAPPNRVLRIFNHLHEGSTTYEDLHRQQCTACCHPLAVRYLDLPRAQPKGLSAATNAAELRSAGQPGAAVPT